MLLCHFEHTRVILDNLLLLFYAKIAYKVYVAFIVITLTNKFLLI